MCLLFFCALTELRISIILRDGDGVPDGFDNCVDLPNGEQADADGDNIGTKMMKIERSHPGYCTLQLFKFSSIFKSRGTNELLNERIHVRVNEHMSEQTSERTDGRMDGRMSERAREGLSE